MQLLFYHFTKEERNWDRYMEGVGDQRNLPRDTWRQNQNLNLRESGFSTSQNSSQYPCCLTVHLPAYKWKIHTFSSVQSFSRVQLFVTPWTAACQASLSITNSQGLLKLMFIELVMPSNHLILCRPLLLLPPIFPRIRVFSSESALRIRWPKYWSFSFNISPSNEY